MSAAWLSLPAVSALGLLKFLAEGADKYLNIALWYPDIVLLLFSLELPFDFLIVTETALGSGGGLDAVVKGGHDCGGRVVSAYLVMG